jgi:hypothetical protein
MYIQKTFTPANVSTTGFATSVTGAAFTLTANTSGDSLAHQVTILNNTANSHAGKTITLVGTDADGFAQTETITGPAASATVSSTKYYLTLTSVTPSSTIGADTFSIGWSGLFSTRTIALDWRCGNMALSVDVSGTIVYNVEQTFDDIQTKTPPFLWTTDDPSTQTAQGVDRTILYLAQPKAIHITTNSYSSGATIVMSITQHDR